MHVRDDGGGGTYRFFVCGNRGYIAGGQMSEGVCAASCGEQEVASLPNSLVRNRPEDRVQVQLKKFEYCDIFCQSLQ